MEFKWQDVPYSRSSKTCRIEVGRKGRLVINVTYLNRKYRYTVTFVSYADYNTSVTLLKSAYKYTKATVTPAAEMAAYRMYKVLMEEE